MPARLSCTIATARWQRLVEFLPSALAYDCGQRIPIGRRGLVAAPARSGYPRALIAPGNEGPLPERGPGGGGRGRVGGDRAQEATALSHSLLSRGTVGGDRDPARAGRRQAAGRLRFGVLSERSARWTRRNPAFAERGRKFASYARVVAVSVQKSVSCPHEDDPGHQRSTACRSQGSRGPAADESDASDRRRAAASPSPERHFRNAQESPLASVQGQGWPGCGRGPVEQQGPARGVGR